MTTVQSTASVCRRPFPTATDPHVGAVPTVCDFAGQAQRRHVGTVGCTITNLGVVVTALRQVDGKLGPSTKIVLETGDGRRVVWYRTRRTSLRPGDEVTITKAHVKGHRAGSGRAETLLTHVSLREKEKLQPALG